MTCLIVFKYNEIINRDFLIFITLLYFGWSIATNKSKNKLISYTLLSAFIFGIILQRLFEAHAHVPGSGVILFALEIIASVMALVLYFGINYLYKKFNPTNKVDS